MVVLDSIELENLTDRTPVIWGDFAIAGSVPGQASCPDKAFPPGEKGQADLVLRRKHRDKT